MSVARVRFDYDPNETKVGDLELKRDEIILIIEKSHTGLWRGRRKDGVEGLFPSNYIQVLHDASAVVFDEDNASSNKSATEKVSKSEQR